jgi:SAM-dependent methyltransferase
VQLSLTPTPIANSFPDKPDALAPRFPLDVQECLSCGHVQLKHKVYVDWSNYRYRTPEANRPHLAAAALAIRSRYPDFKTAIEIGSNNGLYLEELRKQGFNAMGVDPNAIDGVPAPFTYHQAKHLNKVDLIVANNVLAHVDDLYDVFRGIDTVLKDDGALVFEVQYLPSMIESGAFDMIYHEHRDYHTVGPWEKFLKRFGLVITGLKHLETHGGSIRITCERPGQPLYTGDDEQIDWLAFKHRIRDAKQAVQQQLIDVDGPIACFGATAKACTLIHHFGLADKIAYCVDSTPEKHHRYIPGTNIMIHPTAHLDSVPPAAVLLTAWNFEAEIRAQFPNLRFVVPFAKETVCH